MGNLALMAKELGHDVMGVDSKIYPPMSDQLKNANINYLEGFTKENFREARCVYNWKRYFTWK